jgi:hypothetical protein
LNIHVFQAVENSWEDFSFYDNFGKIDGMFGNLGKALTNISLELSIWVRNKGSEIWDSTLINYSLSKFFSVFGNFTKGGS